MSKHNRDRRRGPKFLTVEQQQVVAAERQAERDKRYPVPPVYYDIPSPRNPQPECYPMTGRTRPVKSPPLYTGRSRPHGQRRHKF